MTLRGKALLLIHGTTGALLIIILVLARLIMDSSFQTLEHQEAVKNGERVLIALRHQQEALYTTAEDWATWDDTYAFVQDHNQAYRKSNLAKQTFADLGLDLFLIVDTSGRRVVALAYDRHSRRFAPLPPDLERYLRGKPSLLCRPQDREGKKGLAMLGQRPMLIASLPILTSEKKGPARGSLIMGRYLGGDIIKELAASAQVNLKIRPWSQAVPPFIPARARSRLQAGEPLTLGARDDFIMSYVLLPDLLGRPALVLKTMAINNIRQMARSTMTYIMLAFLGAGVVISLVTLAFLEKFMMARLGLLSHRVERIARRGDFSSRVGLEGNDEVGRLGQGIDHMLEALERARRQGEEAEQRYRVLTESASAAIFIVQDEKLRYVNQASEHLIGYSQKELLGKPFWKLVHPDFRDTLRQRSRDRQRGLRAPSRYECKVLTRHLGERWWDVSAAYIDFQGQPAILGTAFDITERKQAEQALRNSEERYRSFMQNFQGIVLRTRLDYTPIFFLGAVEDITGYREEEFLAGDPKWYSIVYPHDRRYVLETGLSLTRQAGHRLEREYRIICKNGQVRWVQDKLQNICDQQGNPLFVEGAVFDITERKQAEEEKAALEAQLRQAQKMEALGVLAEGIAHDFNNLLQVIGGQVDLLASLPEGKDNHTECLGRISQAVGRASELVQGLLTFGRKGDPQLAPLDLNQQVREVMALLERTLPKMIRLEADLEDSLRLIRADANQVHQVLLNLAGNAADAMPQGGCLLFATRNLQLDRKFCARHHGLKPGDYVLLEVSDTGCGMDDHTLKHIFDPFFTTKQVGKGTGLGMAIVYSIVQNHQGIITCRSRPQEGTSFQIYWPALPEEVKKTMSQEQRQNRAPGGQESILAVEDEELICDMLRDFLSMKGYKVTLATSGEQAVEIYRQGPGDYQLVILDLGLPGMGGERTLEELIKINSGVKVLVATGYQEEDKLQRVRALGAKGILFKPYRLTDLQQTVRELLDS